eukprot:scaffold38123_cov31-Prasinocladus_malaysianus.AAC.1
MATVTFSRLSTEYGAAQAAHAEYTLQIELKDNIEANKAYFNICQAYDIHLALRKGRCDLPLSGSQTPTRAARGPCTCVGITGRHDQFI